MTVVCTKINLGWKGLNYVAPLFLTCLMCKCQTIKNILNIQDLTCSQWWTFRLWYCRLYCLIHGYQCSREIWYCNSILKTEAVGSSITILTTYHISDITTQNTNNFKLFNYSAQSSLFIGALLGNLEGVRLSGLLRDKKSISGFLFGPGGY